MGVIDKEPIIYRSISQFGRTCQESSASLGINRRITPCFSPYPCLEPFHFLKITCLIIYLCTYLYMSCCCSTCNFVQFVCSRRANLSVIIDNKDYVFCILKKTRTFPTKHSPQNAPGTCTHTCTSTSTGPLHRLRGLIASVTVFNDPPV